MIELKGIFLSLPAKASPEIKHLPVEISGYVNSYTSQFQYSALKTLEDSDTFFAGFLNC